MSYQWWKFLHLVGVFGFLASHGVSMTVAMRLRSERDRERIRTMLQLSGSSIAGFYGSFGVLLLGGIVAASQGHWWSSQWIWESIGILVAITVAMMVIARPYYQRIKEALEPSPSGVPNVSDEDLAARLSSPVPLIIVAIGMGGLLAILYLMVFKP